MNKISITIVLVISAVVGSSSVMAVKKSFESHSNIYYATKIINATPAMSDSLNNIRHKFDINIKQDDGAITPQGKFLQSQDAIDTFIDKRTEQILLRNGIVENDDPIKSMVSLGSKSLLNIR